MFSKLAPVLLIAAAAAVAQNGPLDYSVSTPRPINPATDSSNPSARATQTLNPYLGSTPEGPVTPGELKLGLEDAVQRGLRFNLGLIDSAQADANTRALRERALSALLPQISARAQQTYEDLSLRELGLRLPAKAGFSLPATSGGFGYSDARIVAQSSIVNFELLDKYKAQKADQEASLLSTKDARDVVVYAVGSAYFQVVASHARLQTAQAALASARELNAQTADQYKAEVSPEIDTLRAQVELSSAEQRVVNAANDLEKDKLTLDRITGIPLGQAWIPSRDYDYVPIPREDESSADSNRFDVASLKQSVSAAELNLKAARAERLPQVSFEASYGAGGLNPGNYNQVYALSGSVSVPIFTGGRIRSDEHQAQAALAQRRAEYRDIESRVDYDVRVALLDTKASDSAVKVAAKNKVLAARALTESEDRYRNGVTNYLEVVQAQEVLVAANENYIGSLFSFNVAKVALARALGSSENRLASLFGSK
jgi:outer membrane protein TolC